MNNKIIGIILFISALIVAFALLFLRSDTNLENQNMEQTNSEMNIETDSDSSFEKVDASQNEMTKEVKDETEVEIEKELNNITEIENQELTEVIE